MASTRKQFAVIGLGRFGQAVCRTLYGYGHEVLAIDRDPELIHAIQTEDIATHALQANAAEPHSLKEAGIADFDAVVMAIGNDLEAGILTTLNLIDLGVKCIISKAANARHADVLERIGGGDVQVVFPEAETGERIARSLAGVNALETIALHPDYQVAEVEAPRSLVGKKLIENGVRARLGVVIIAIRRGDALVISPGADDVIRANDILTILGPNAGVDTLRRE